MNNKSIIRQAGPFLAMMTGGVFAIYFFQRAKFEFSLKNKESILDPNIEKTLKSLNSNRQLDQIYEELCNEADSDNWENVRGPRPDEDNREFLLAKERRQRKQEERQNEIIETKRNALKQILTKQDGQHR